LASTEFANHVLDLVEDFPGAYSRYLDSVKVIECSSSQAPCGPYRLADVALDVQAYQLRPSEAEGSQQQADRLEEDSPQARVVPLPSKDLDGIWESYESKAFAGTQTVHTLIADCRFRLLFDEPIPTKLLRAVSRMSESPFYAYSRAPNNSRGQCSFRVGS
jgi:ubiquinol-cytochrome c reductase cytochrome c1 subunit